MLRRILLASAGIAALTGAAAAADLTAHPPPPAYIPPPPPPLWTGFYAGLSVGGAWGSNNNVDTLAVNTFDNYATAAPAVGLAGAAPGLDSAASQTNSVNMQNRAGVIGGGQVGYNFQFYNNFVVGIEADISGLSQRAYGGAGRSVTDPISGDTANAFIANETGVEWLGTVRGRLGWLITPTFLIYGDGGLAYGGVRAATYTHAFWTPGGALTAGDEWTDSFGSISQSGNNNETRVGWTAGGGVEWMFMPNWSLKVEYLYYDLGSVTWLNSPNSSIASTTDAIGALAGTVNATNVSASRTTFNGNIVRLGLNYHFWSAPPPVVAKY
jgi:outer membrane immunogenic protein